MKEKIDELKEILRVRYSIYPIMLGILFLLNDYRKYGVFYTAWQNIFLSLIVLTFVAVSTYLSLRFIRNKMKAALVISIFIFINLFYQDITIVLYKQNSIDSFVKSITAYREIFTIPFLILLWVVLSLLILKSKRQLYDINLFLNITISVYVILELIFLFTVPVNKVELSDREPFPVIKSISKEYKPDIYYIVLDSYTSSESLKKYWNFENDSFEINLQKLGFSVIQQAKAAYTYTPYAIASYLNSSELVIDTTKKYNERNLIMLIRKNRMDEWLKCNNYNCYNYSLFDCFGHKKYYNAFTYYHFLGRTIWYTNAVKLYHFIHPQSRYTQTNLEIFEVVKSNAAGDNGNPKFIYAHLMTPHSPYVFDSTGKPFEENSKLSDEEKYLQQLIFVNSKALDLVTHILENSEKEPVIIIQGDHGFRYQGHPDEAHSIFYAIHSPGYLETDTLRAPTHAFKDIIMKINSLELSQD